MGNILENCSAVTLAAGALATQSDPEAVVVHTRVLDETVPADLEVAFNAATPATVAAVERHYDEHRYGSFPFTPPSHGTGTGTPIQVEYLAPPAIRWQGARTCTITVRLRRALFSN